jgi:hypothetical protein
MARMTPNEATTVNVLLGYLAGKDEQLPREVVLGLETLGSCAHNRLQTGWSESSVRDSGRTPTARADGCAQKMVSIRGIGPRPL